MTTIIYLEGMLKKDSSPPNLTQFKKPQGSKLRGIALDEENGILYASDSSKDVIWKTTIDGKDLEILTRQKGTNSIPFSFHKSLKNSSPLSVAMKTEVYPMQSSICLVIYHGLTRGHCCADSENHTIRAISIGKKKDQKFHA